MGLSMAKRLARFDKFAERGILRQEWTSYDTGKKRACLLAALSPKAARSMNPLSCPASVMPKWLAMATPTIDDCTSEGYWPEMVKQYRVLAEGWPSLSKAQWTSVEEDCGNYIRELVGADKDATMDWESLDTFSHSAYQSKYGNRQNEYTDDVTKFIFDRLAKEIAVAKGCVVTEAA